MELREIIQAARGEIPVDLFLANGRVVNVFDGTVTEGGVAILGSQIVGVMAGEYEARQVIDLQGQWVAPGFIDGHIHIESSMLPPHTFAQAVVPRGTTTVIIDPHEIANVLGLDGIHYMLESAKYNPLSIYIMLPSLVPATNMETSGAELNAMLLLPFRDTPWVLGLAEVPHALILNRDKRTLEKIESIGQFRADGHLPGLRGKDLMAVAAAGIRSDHETVEIEEGREKLKSGIHLFIREGSAAKNMEALLPLVTAASSRRVSFVSDDKNPLELLQQGHLDHVLRKAIALGLDPVIALQMVTINTAEYFGLRNLGAVAPGWRADLVTFDNPADLQVDLVIRAGQVVAKGGRLAPDTDKDGGQRSLPELRGTVNIHWLRDKEFAVPAGDGPIRVIELVKDQIITRLTQEPPLIKDGHAVSDVDRDIIKLGVVERHRASGNVGTAFVRGFGLKAGAMASTVSHDSHNIVVVGVNDHDMIEAVIELRRMQGGMVIMDQGKPLAKLALPIAGLMSSERLEVLVERVREIQEAAASLGCTLSEPMMHLSFLALPVIPEIRLTDRGLVDVGQMAFVPLFLGAGEGGKP